MQLNGTNRQEEYLWTGGRAFRLHYQIQWMPILRGKGGSQTDRSRGFAVQKIAGVRIVGAVPYAVFDSTIKDLLSAK